MTSGKHRKRLVRQRAARTGETYTTALRHIRYRQEGHMPSSTPSTKKFLATCTFCSKPNTEVKKLIAGPGVYICDECVALCSDIVNADMSADEAAAAREAYENRSGPEILVALPAVAAAAASVEADLRRLVTKLRAEGTPWEDIAARLKLDPREAQTRFEGPAS